MCVRSSVAGRPQARDLAGEIERVLHVARRMLGRHVERFEVVVVVFDLGAFEHLIAQAREDRLDLLAHDRQRMAMADLRGAAGQGDVDRADRRFRRLERGLALVELLLDFLFELVGALPSTGLSSGGAEATDFISAVTRPFFRPRYLSRSDLQIRLPTTRAPSPAGTRRAVA